MGVRLSALHPHKLGLAPRKRPSRGIHQGARLPNKGDLTPKKSLTLMLNQSPPGDATTPTMLTDFSHSQRKDPTLQHANEQLAQVDGSITNPWWANHWSWFKLTGDRLYHVDQDHWQAILILAHDIPAAGYLGQEKTLARVLTHFFWLMVHREVKECCNLCPKCQLASPPGVQEAPLVSLPIVGAPFKQVAMDLEGPLLKSNIGYWYIIVHQDKATLFPGAILLRNTTTCTIAAELVKVFARV